MCIYDNDQFVRENKNGFPLGDSRTNAGRIVNDIGHSECSSLNN